MDETLDLVADETRIEDEADYREWCEGVDAGDREAWMAAAAPDDGGDEEMAVCSHCGRAVDYQDTVDGECPECDGAASDLGAAEEDEQWAEAEVERLWGELAEARAALREARKAASRAMRARERRAAE